MPMPASSAACGEPGASGASAPSASATAIDPFVGHVVAEQDVHQRGLAGAVLAEQREDLPAPQLEIDRVVRDERAEALADAGKRQDERLRSCSRTRGSADVHHGYDDFGSASLMLTRNMPSLISFSFSLTSFTISGATSFSSITRLAPPCAMKLNGP